MGRRPTKTTGEKDPWQARFVAALEKSPNISAAARAAGINRTYAYAHREENADFAAAWDAAIQKAVDELEAAAFRRGKARSDTLAIFLLKSHRAEVYGERKPPPQDVNVHLTGLESIAAAFDRKVAGLAAATAHASGAGGDAGGTEGAEDV